MPSIFGPLLLGIGKGMQDYDKAQEDLSYTRQTRAQEIQQGNLANQQKQLQVQGLQQQQKDEALAREQALRAKASSDQSSSDLAAERARLMDGGPPQSPGAALNGAAQPGQQPGLPDAKTLPTSYDAPKAPILAIDKINAAEKAGLEVNLDQFSSLDKQEQVDIAASNSLAQKYRAQAAEYAKQGTPEGNAQASAKMKQADDLTQRAAAITEKRTAMATKQTDLVEKQIKVQDSSLNSVKEQAREITNQKDYTSFLNNVRSNPALAAAARSLNLTGDYAIDRPKINKLAQDTVTLADQQRIRLDAQRTANDTRRTNIAEQEQKRKTEKDNEAKVMQAQASLEDKARFDKNSAKGVPTVATPGSLFTDKVTARQEAGKIQAANLKQQQLDVQAQNTNRAIIQDAQKLKALINSGRLQTGTTFAAAADANQKGMMNNILISKLSTEQQEYFKTANQLAINIAKLQQSAGGRVSLGIGMTNFIASGKPNISLDLKANAHVVDELAAAATDTANAYNFVTEFSQANPTAPRETGAELWNTYRSAEPLFVTDPKTWRMVPNPEADPGSPKYIGPDKFFKRNGMLDGVIGG